MSIFNSEKKIEANYALAGQLVHQYAGSTKMYEYFGSIFDQVFGEVLTKNFGDDKWTSNLDRCWVNYQQKYEFNPVHDHTGEYSFVYWVKIPYDLEEEYKNPAVVNARDRCVSQFNFVYTNLLGMVSNLQIPLTKDHEGCMVIFPACLKHVVYPFYTSDDMRISISGNFSIQHPSGKKIAFE